MKIVLQRCSSARVSVNNQITGQIDKGFCLLVGIGIEDTPEDADWLAEKILKLRLFSDSENKMNLDIVQVGGSILSISQFTLLSNYKKGNRPSYTQAAPGPIAEPLWHYFNQKLSTLGLKVETGIFGSDMKVEIHNDGPVTLVLDSVTKT